MWAVVIIVILLHDNIDKNVCIQHSSIELDFCFINNDDNNNNQQENLIKQMKKIFQVHVLFIIETEFNEYF